MLALSNVYANVQSLQLYDPLELVYPHPLFSSDTANSVCTWILYQIAERAQGSHYAQVVWHSDRFRVMRRRRSRDVAVPSGSRLVSDLASDRADRRSLLRLVKVLTDVRARWDLPRSGRGRTALAVSLATHLVKSRPNGGFEMTSQTRDKILRRLRLQH